MLLRDCIREKSNFYFDEISALFNGADIVTLFFPQIDQTTDQRLDSALKSFKVRAKRIVVILDTFGGLVESVEKMVDLLRGKYDYEEVVFIVPEKAMSAGTVFVMSGDRILMTKAACLGPIDPQVVQSINNERKLVPALSYLTQFERLSSKSKTPGLSPLELTLAMKQYDYAELHRFEQARDYSVDLLEKWLTQYKFKDWKVTETTQRPVDMEMRSKRAKEVAKNLNDHVKWHTHSRGINMKTLIDDVGLRIEDVDDIQKLSPLLTDYWELFKDFMSILKFQPFVHTKEFF